ncbi:hypothetical protein JCM1840_007355 [Sporobolomyces johnsonii]
MWFLRRYIGGRAQERRQADLDSSWSGWTTTDATTNAGPVITVRTEGHPPGFPHDLAIRDGLAVDNTTSAANSSSPTPLSTSSPSSSSSSSIPITWILIFLVPALVVVGIVLFCRFSCGRNRRKMLEQQQAEDEELAVQQQALQARPRDSDWSGASNSEISGADDDDERIRRTR